MGAMIGSCRKERSWLFKRGDSAFWEIGAKGNIEGALRLESFFGIEQLKLREIERLEVTPGLQIAHQKIDNGEWAFQYTRTRVHFIAKKGKEVAREVGFRCQICSPCTNITSLKQSNHCSVFKVDVKSHWSVSTYSLRIASSGSSVGSYASKQYGPIGCPPHDLIIRHHRKPNRRLTNYLPGADRRKHPQFVSD